MAEDSAASSVFAGAGLGVFAGLLAVLATHWFWGDNVIVLPLVYGYALSRLRGWPELAALLTMVGATVAYGVVYDVVARTDLGLATTLGVSAGVIVAFVIVVYVVGERVDRARTRAVHRAYAAGHDPERATNWEERHYARLRARRAEGRSLVRGPATHFGVWLVTCGAALAVTPTTHLRSLGAALFGLSLLEFVLWHRMTRYRRRLLQPGAELAIGLSDRRPVLFLRPFALDALAVSPFRDGCRPQAFSLLDKHTYEELAAEAFAGVGPVTAVGRPGEEIALLGAAREYADEATWRDLVLRRAAAARCVLFEVDASPGLEWELREVPARVGLQRVVILLPPEEHADSPRGGSWREHWAGLREVAGFLPDVADDTAAVVFDDRGAPALVATGGSVRATLEAVRDAWLAARSASPGSGGSWSQDPGAGSRRDEQPEPDPRMRRELAAMRAQLGGLTARRSLLHGKADAEALALRQQLAAVYLAEGRTGRALKLQGEVADLNRRHRGPTHPETLAALHDLARMVRLTGDLTRFADLMAQVGEGTTALRGESDPATVQARTTFALALQEQGRLPEARAVLEAALAHVAGQPSPRPPEVRKAERVLGSVLISAGDPERGRALLERVLEEEQSVHGPRHPDTLDSQALLAEGRAMQGEFEAAAALAREVAAVADEVIGPTHPVTAKYLMNAARISADAGHAGAARTLAEQAYEATRPLGEEHPDALTALSVLGRARAAQGQLEPALELFLLAWQGRRKVLGDTHPHTLAALTSAASTQVTIGRIQEGLAGLQRALAAYTATLGTHHPHTRLVAAEVERVRSTLPSPRRAGPGRAGPGRG